MTDAGMVIVGAGKAGTQAAISLRELGYKGSITLIGDELHVPYDRPPLSKQALTDEEDPQPAALLDSHAITSLGVSHVAGIAATGIDRTARQVVMADGRRIAYDKLLLATGAAARALPLAGGERALSLRSFEQMLVLRRSLLPGATVAIIGGGFIGLEVAASAVRRGAKVTVVEAQSRVLMRAVPEEVSRVVTEAHARHGVEIVTSAAIDRIERNSIVLSEGRRIQADILIAGVGAVPVVNLAEACELRVENGIACDAHLGTSDPDIFGAGDCISFPHRAYGGKRLRLESWRAAQDMGAVAAENMLGGRRIHDAIPWFWSDQYELGLQIAGLPAEGAHSVRRSIKGDAFIMFYFASDGRLVGAAGIGVGQAVARDIRLAEMLIARSAAPDPAALADASLQLKSFLN